MRIAHLIMAYKNPNQVARLVQRLQHSNCDIFIHLDKKIDISEYCQLIGLEAKFIQHRTLCNWGGFSFVKAILRSTEEILSQGNYGFINLLSAQDYPLRSMDEIFCFFNENAGTSFISYDLSNDTHWWKEATSRYQQYHFTDFRFRGKYLLQRIVNFLLPKRTIPFSERLFGGSNSTWWTISAECAEYVIQYLRDHPKLMKFMSNTWAADEFLITSIIMNSPYKDKIVNNNYRFIEWEKGAARPKILVSGHLEPLLKSGQLFARKFDCDIDSDIIDQLDTIVLKK